MAYFPKPWQAASKTRLFGALKIAVFSHFPDLARTLQK
jgi:hypothetical protein